MANRMFERFPRGFYAPVYNRFDPTEFFGDRSYKRRIPGCTIDHYTAQFANVAAAPPMASPIGAGGVAVPSAISTVTYHKSLEDSVRIVSNYAIRVVEKAVTDVGIKGAVITSTLRVPAKQADIMYGEATKSIQAQYDLYGAAGDQIVDVYKKHRNKPKDEVVKLMTEKIEALHAKGIRVSLHVSTVEQYEKLNVFDIGVNSTKAVAGEKFSIPKITAAFNKLKKSGHIKHFIDETKKSNNCWHLEIVPNIKAL